MENSITFNVFFIETFPYRIRGAVSGNIRLEANISTDSFRYRAMISYNVVPGKVKKGSIGTVKKNLKQWVLKNVPIDWT